MIKLKKIFTIIGCILFATVMTSCTNTSDLGVDTKNDLPVEPNDYVIYCYPATGEMIKVEQDSTDITFKDAETKVFSFSSKTEISKPSNVDNQKTLELNGKTYSLQYSRTYETALSSSNTFKDYSQFNAYKNDTIRADTRVSTNELLFFTNLDENDLQATGDLTESEAKNIAEATIRSLYGETVQQAYTYEQTIYTDTELAVQYTVVYRKYVWGTPTNDAIQISVNRNGEVVGVNAKYLGMYSLAENQIEKEAIADAISKLEATFSKTWIINNTTLIIDAEGDYYISAQLSRTNAEEVEALEVYINV